MRVAYVSPLPPQRSGIADYSAELVPHLAEHVELDLFTDRPEESSRAMPGTWPVRAIGELPDLASSFDAVLYHLGNNPDYHGSTFDMLMRVPGVVMLHEFMLHHLVQGLTVARGDLPAYVEEMRYCYGQTGGKLARRHLETGLPIDVWRYPLFERVVDRSLALLTHNEATRQRVLASRPGTPIQVVPHHLALDRLPAGDGHEVRERFDVPPDAFLVGSFGFVTPQKRLDVSLRAFAELRRQQPESRYLLAGEVSPYYDLAALLDGELGEGVIVTGRLSLEDLLASMQACDVAVNLRYPSGGETSGTLMRLLGLGKPVIVSNHGSFAEVPDGCCAKLDLGDMEATVLSEFLLALARDRDLGRRMGENARRHMREHHTLQGSAAVYAAFLEHISTSDRRPFRVAPPLAAEGEAGVASALVEDVGAAMADLGVADIEVDLVEQVATVLVDLGLDAPVAESGPPTPTRRF